MNMLRTLCLGTCLLACSLAVFPSASLHSQPEWEEFGELSFPRAFHEALYIGDGKVLVLGGTDYNQLLPLATAACEIIDVHAGTVKLTDSMSAPHSETVALLTRDSNVVVVSGLAGQFDRGDLTDKVEMYSRETGTWTTLGRLAIARRQHVAAFISDHEILVVGGRHQDHRTMADAEIFDISTGQSRPATRFPFVINSASMEIRSDGGVIVFGGREGGENSARRDFVYRYNIAEDRWEQSGSVAKPMQGTCALKLWDGRVLVSGGSYKENPVQFSDLVQIEDDGVWSTVGSMQTERQWGAAAQWDDGMVMTGGGYDNDLAVLSSCDFVDIEQGRVSAGPELQHARAFQAFVTVPTCSEPLWAKANGSSRGVVILAIGGRASLAIDSGLTSIEIIQRACLPDVRIDAGTDTIICSGSTLTLGGDPTLSGDAPFLEYEWSPLSGLSCSNCENPVAAPDRTTEYILTVRDGDGNRWYDTVRVIVAPDSMHYHIPRDIKGKHGGLVEFPVFLDDPVDTEILHSFELRLQYDPVMMHPLIPIELEGGILNGWNAEVVSDAGGVLTLRLEAGDDAEFTRSSGLLLCVKMATYLEDESGEFPLPDSASIPFELDLTGLECVAARCNPGFVFLENGITSTPGDIRVSFGLRSVGANPFHGKTRLRFEVSATSHTLLTVSDMTGKEVARLVDERMERGEHTVELNASGLSPGVYLCRLVSDGRSDSKLVIVK